MVLPYLEVSTPKRVFLNGERARTLFSAGIVLYLYLFAFFATQNFEKLHSVVFLVIAWRKMRTCDPSLSTALRAIFY